MTAKKLSRSALFSLWVFENGAAAGLAVAALLASVLGVFVFVPMGPPEDVTGKIERFGSVESTRGSYPVAVVLIGQLSYTIALPRVTTCAAGDTIHFSGSTD